ncbi:conserved hypothetical protein [Talaromyces stipitatus ATCC 10500]|uniref:Uncharacterized protein n=1 Tax=Talaromyces stipitatus (strain ATCC 10500 / CBS 375.48 / QM 6759 / NRRL 1006) TaxID=441959 RepID=B8MGW1_TALSN|nr:uncharacterized protein TSTA_014330 [Talaromyces stipitatus ATCC 10500]EED16342.1 conserved hypothetical protein [Talaromyces stipitatus ATCC 10500]
MRSRISLTTMTRVKADGVNGTTKHTHSKTSTVAVEKGRGHSSGSDPFRAADTEDHLATQLPSRPPSRESITSQDGDIGGHTAPSSESHEGLATQVHQSIPRQNIPRATPAEPTMSNYTRNGASLLKLLGNGNRQGPLSKQPPPQQESQQVGEASSHPGTPSSELGTNHEQTYGEDKLVTEPLHSEHTRFSSNGQQRMSSPPRRQLPSFQKPDESFRDRFGKAGTNSQEDVTSFQVQPPSSLETTATIAENGNNPMGPPEKNSRIYRSRLTQPAREENTRHDPWSGMKKLRRRDVFIPDDQEELLDRPDCWIPPDVGHPYPRGHVPPSLLKEWNTKMIRLFRDARRAHASSQKDEPSREQEEENHEPSPKPLSDDDSDSDSESQTSWSQSPSQHLRKPLAPPDSSPIRLHDGRQPPDISADGIDRPSEPVEEAGHQRKVVTPQPVSQPSQRDEPTREPVASTVDQGQESDPANGPRPIVHVPIEDPRPGGEVAEPSDDSDMETSIPQGLTVRTQDILSQVESSGLIAPNLSDSTSAPAAQVQILDTPAGGLKRAATKRTENLPSHSQEWAAQKSSSGSNKSSSQIIANSLGSTAGSSDQDHQLQDAQKPLVADSQNTNWDLHSSSIPSHQDQRLLEVNPESSLRSADFHTQIIPERHASPKERFDFGTQTSPQRHASPEERPQDDPNPSTGMVIEHRLKRRAADLDAEVSEESPCKRPRRSPTRDVDASRTQDVDNVVDVNHGLVNKDCQEHVCFIQDALRVYDMFKRSYPKYAGNFDHFQSLCHELQSLHRREMLQNSSLWDDFIMRNWVDYGTYVQSCISANEDYESYEDFFTRNFTKPSFRKRNLTPRTLKMIVSKSEPSIEKPTTVDRGVQTIDDNSVSASVIRRSPLVVDQGSKSASREPNTQSTPSNVLLVVDRPHQANIGVKLSTPSTPRKRPSTNDGGMQANIDPPTPRLFINGQSGHGDENIVSREIQETQPPDNILTDEHISDSTKDLTTDYHDLASIELVLDAPMENDSHSPDDENNDRNDPDTIEAEARFNQIPRMRRDNSHAVQALFRTYIPPPPEEQDESTPFKIWARYEHNIVSERRRRGGYRVPLDEDGNIVFEEFEPRIDGRQERVSSFSRWLWRPRDIS